jgi:hypothetical protein
MHEALRNISNQDGSEVRAYINLNKKSQLAYFKYSNIKNTNSTLFNLKNND